MNYAHRALWEESCMVHFDQLHFIGEATVYVFQIQLVGHDF